MKKYYLILLTLFCLFECQGQYRKLHDFNFFDLTNGDGPGGTLVLSGNKLYGMAAGGGKDSVGVIFSIDTNGNGYKILHSFNDTDGKQPVYCSLTLAGNKFYGMTSYGGTSNDGVIFSMDTNGHGYKILFNFNGSNGNSPDGKLTLSGKKLYGSTYIGGTNNDGILFSLDTDGLGYKTLLNFNGANGISPQSSLIQSGSILYGTTIGGGKYNGGTIFSLDTNGGSFITLFNFGDSNGCGISGADANGLLILSGNTLFGTATCGGTDADGTLFSVQTNGSKFKVLYNFSTNCNGENPYCSLALSGNVLYGVSQGGLYGNVFSIDTNGNNYSCLYSFSNTDGARPVDCGLTLWAGMIYGITDNGGNYNDGVIFSYKDSAITTSTAELKINNEELKIYPNPGNGVATVVINNYQLGISNQIDVYNILGEKVCSTFNIQNSTFTIDISGQPAGIYLYRVTSEKGELVGSGKLVIE